MRTSICQALGLDIPIFAFSHCRDVVAEVSKAGGCGVLGSVYLSAEALEQDLSWIDNQVSGKPYGVDVLIPSNYERSAAARRPTPADLPEGQVRFMRDVLDKAGIPRLPEADAEEMIGREIARLHMTPEQIEETIEVALDHPIKVVVNALGVPAPSMVDRLHARDILVGAMVGKVEHARRQKAAGVDFVIAQGTEAGGHTGQVSSLVLWPQVVDAVAPLPVLAAGGIGRGRQMAAALALGAQGIWCGSIWLGTVESEVGPELKERLFAAHAEDAEQSLVRTGKPCRLLRSKLTDAWKAPDAPAPLPMPLQTLAMSEARLRVERARAKDYMSYPVGQIVGDMRAETRCRRVIYEMLEEFGETAAALGEMVALD